LANQRSLCTTKVPCGQPKLLVATNNT
jgi:hypothetical protein